MKLKKPRNRRITAVFGNRTPSTRSPKRTSKPQILLISNGGEARQASERYHHSIKSISTLTRTLPITDKIQKANYVRDSNVCHGSKKIIKTSISFILKDYKGTSNENNIRLL